MFLENLQERLTTELKRVGPQVIAKETGISRATLYNWMEKGNTPLDKLVLLQEAGVDVTYILTGQRNPAMPAPQPTLTRRQAALLDHYDHLTETDKSALERTAFALAEQGKVGKKGRAA